MLPVYKAKKINTPINNIVLVWAESSSHENDANRSMSLEDLSHLLELNDYKFFSLQMGDPRRELTTSLKYIAISDIMRGVTDFRDSIERLPKIDLLITVDRAMAHLAGAIGCKTFVLLPQVPDWRWMLGRQDSPWYSSIRLFRQREAKNWRDPINSIRYELEMIKQVC